MKINCTMDTAAFSQMLDDVEKRQLPFATAKALTNTAKKAQIAIRQTMASVFDRPTPYTQNSTYLVPATKTSLFAEVRLKTRASGGVPASVYLAPEVYGGPRQFKASELLLQRRGVLPGGMAFVPGAGAKLDAYGNITRGQMSIILSTLTNGNAAGFAGKGFKRGKRVNQQAPDIFAIAKRTGNLNPGVYLRTPKGPVPLLVFVRNAPHYSVRLPFADVVGTVYLADFQTEFANAFADAVATAITK